MWWAAGSELWVAGGGQWGGWQVAGGVVGEAVLFAVVCGVGVCVCVGDDVDGGGGDGDDGDDDDVDEDEEDDREE